MSSARSQRRLGLMTDAPEGICIALGFCSVFIVRFAHPILIDLLLLPLDDFYTPNYLFAKDFACRIELRQVLRNDVYNRLVVR